MFGGHDDLGAEDAGGYFGRGEGFVRGWVVEVGAAAAGDLVEGDDQGGVEERDEEHEVVVWLEVAGAEAFEAGEAGGEK